MTPSQHYQTVIDHMTSRDPDTPSDDVILGLAPPLPVQPKLALLDEASLLRVANCSSLSDVEVGLSLPVKIYSASKIFSLPVKIYSVSKISLCL